MYGTATAQCCAPSRIAPRFSAVDDPWYYTKKASVPVRDDALNLNLDRLGTSLIFIARSPPVRRPPVPQRSRRVFVFVGLSAFPTDTDS
jgi:hypothetical protein